MDLRDPSYLIMGVWISLVLLTVPGFLVWSWGELTSRKASRAQHPNVVPFPDVRGAETDEASTRKAA